MHWLHSRNRIFGEGCVSVSGNFLFDVQSLVCQQLNKTFLLISDNTFSNNLEQDLKGKINIKRDKSPKFIKKWWFVFVIKQEQFYILNHNRVRSWNNENNAVNKVEHKTDWSFAVEIFFENYQLPLKKILYFSYFYIKQGHW